MAQLVKCPFCKHGDPSSSPRTACYKTPGVVAHAWHPSWKAEMGGSGLPPAGLTSSASPGSKREFASKTNWWHLRNNI